MGCLHPLQLTYEHWDWSEPAVVLVPSLALPGTAVSHPSSERVS